MLQRVDHAHGLIHISAQWQVIHQLVANFSVAVDQEQTTVCDQLAFRAELLIFIVVIRTRQDVVVGGDRLVGVRNDRIGHPLDTTFVLAELKPAPVALFGIGGNRYDLDILALEIGQTLLECMEFGRTDESEILWVKEKDHILLSEVLIQ